MSSSNPDLDGSFDPLSSPLQLYLFLSKHDVAVVHVITSPFELSNRHLGRQLQEAISPEIGLGRIYRGVLPDPLPKDLADQLRDLDLPADLLLPGYYFVRGRRLLGWHPGTLPEEVQGGAAAVSAVVGFVKLLTTDSLLEGFVGAFKTFSSISSHAAFAYFFNLFEQSNCEPGEEDKRSNRDHARAAQQHVREDLLERYSELLDVSPTASESEIKTAYRAKVREIHPDKGAPEEQSIRNEQTRNLNIAREFLLDNVRRQGGPKDWSKAAGQ